MRPQAEEHPEPPESGRGKEGFSLRDFVGSTAQLVLLASRATREYISVVLSSPVGGHKVPPRQP